MTCTAIHLCPCREMVKVREMDYDMQQSPSIDQIDPQIDPHPQINSWCFSAQLNVNDPGLSAVCKA